MNTDQHLKHWSKQATWLLPGLYIKRWLGIIVTGLLCIIIGVALLFVLIH